jgi:hypothetical protein
MGTLPAICCSANSLANCSSPILSSQSVMLLCGTCGLFWVLD